jgi:lysophospholipid acyltransferase (LPLAT)-like uncharacterized protein
MGPVVLAKRNRQSNSGGDDGASEVLDALRTWDTFQIPKPFTRAKIFVAEPIYVAATAADEELEIKRQELQRSLDDLTQRGEQWRANL